MCRAQSIPPNGGNILARWMGFGWLGGPNQVKPGQRLIPDDKLLRTILRVRLFVTLMLLVTVRFIFQEHIHSMNEFDIVLDKIRSDKI